MYCNVSYVNENCPLSGLLDGWATTTTALNDVIRKTVNGQASQYVEQSVRAGRGRGRVGHQKMLLIKAYIEDCGRRFLVVAHAEQAESEKQQIPCTAFSNPDLQRVAGFANDADDLLEDRANYTIHCRLLILGRFLWPTTTSPAIICKHNVHDIMFI